MLRFKIDFSLRDIDSIIVESQSDIADFESFINGLSDSRFSSQEKEKLCQKIMVAEDFKIKESS